MSSLTLEPYEEPGRPAGGRRSLRGLPSPRPDAAVHPTLAAALAALEAAGVTWALLRGADDLAAPDGDVDLLVDPARRADLDALLRPAGFFRLPAAGHGSHRFYFAYDRRSGVWLKLDVVSTVDFGPFLQWRTTTAQQCLSRRVRFESGWLLAPDDAFWHLLLHCLVDRGGLVRARRRDDLAAAARRATATGPLARLVDEVADERLDAAALLDQARQGDWKRLIESGRLLRARWTRRRPLGVSAVRVRNRCLRTAGQFRPRPGTGVSVALLGPDGAGKTTLAEGLMSTVPMPSKYLYMGLWRAGRLDRFLRRLPGAQLALRLLKLFVKAGQARTYWLLGRLVLLDRFTYDASLPEPGAGLRERISARLVLRTNPPPDLIVLLDAPGELMFARKGEHSVEALERRRQGYLALRERFPQMVVVDATQPAEAVRREVTEVIWRRRFDRGRTA